MGTGRPADGINGTTSRSPSHLVLEYLSAFSSGDFARARSLTSEDFSLCSPCATWWSACWRKTPLARGRRADARSGSARQERASPLHDAERGSGHSTKASFDRALCRAWESRRSAEGIPWRSVYSGRIDFGGFSRDDGRQDQVSLLPGGGGLLSDRRLRNAVQRPGRPVTPRHCPLHFPNPVGHWSRRFLIRSCSPAFGEGSIMCPYDSGLRRHMARRKSRPGAGRRLQTPVGLMLPEGITGTMRTRQQARAPDAVGSAPECHGLISAAPPAVSERPRQDSNLRRTVLVAARRTLRPWLLPRCHQHGVAESADTRHLILLPSMSPRGHRSEHHRRAGEHDRFIARRRHRSPSQRPGGPWPEEAALEGRGSESAWATSCPPRAITTAA